MGKKRTPGLVRRGQYWHIDKRIPGYGTLRESTKESELAAAEQYLAHRLNDIRQAVIYGMRPRRVFAEAATKYLEEGSKRSMDRDADALKMVMPYIGTLPLDAVHHGTLGNYIQARRAAGTRSATVNRDLAVVRTILNLASRLWRDENGLSWLEVPPLIREVELGRPPQTIPTILERATALNR